MRWTKRATSLAGVVFVAGCSSYVVPPRLDPQLAPATLAVAGCTSIEGHRLYPLPDSGVTQAEQALGQTDVVLAASALAAALVPGAETVPLMIDGSGVGADFEAARRAELARDTTLSDPALKRAAHEQYEIAADTWLAKGTLQPYVVRSVMAEDRAGSFRACWSGTELHVNFVAAGRSSLPFAERPLVALLERVPTRILTDIDDEPATAALQFEVYFDFGKAEIDAAGRMVIAAAADAARSGHLAHLVVTGRTDTVGTIGFNQSLSERRAAAVAGALAADGIAESDIETRALGKGEPVLPTGDNVREAKNRIVTIDLEPQPGA
jgi:outer membrane protein OmpA-like peptidoglycan-associated protein